MNCRDFTRSLLSYVRGELAEPGFGEMVAHEADCPECRRRIAEHHAVDLSAEGPSSDIRVERKSDQGGSAEFLASVIERTSGADCDWVSLRMAEAMDEPFAPESVRPVRDHLVDCRSCQRLRDQLNALPEYYAALPVLSPDRQFTEDVLARTVGPQPSFLAVIRAIWKTPGTLWESAVACALVAAAIFGSVVPSFDTVSETVRGAVQSAQIATVRWGVPQGIEGQPSLIRRWSASATEAWDGVEDRAGQVSEWSERTADDMRARDFPRLIEDIRVVLEPLGLYPGAETESEVEIEAGVEADSDRATPEKPEELK